MSGPFLGVFFHWLGGLASGSFYVPFRFVKKWSWEVYWLAGGFFSWIIAPWLMAFLLTKDLPGVLAESFRTQQTAVFWAFLFGMMWGLGGLTFGLTMRYLGLSLGMAIALGYCMVFGFIMPPIFNFEKGDFMNGEFMTRIVGTASGNIVLFGVFIGLLGIVIGALAGLSKEREMSEDAKRAAIKEFSFIKGLLIATFSGIFSAGMSYGMDAAKPIADISMTHGTEKMWSELPRLCIILAGGFTSNFIWCLFLFLKNGTLYQFTAKEIKEKDDSTAVRVPMLWNYFFCALAGTTWYFQFFFYSMGETQMGDYNFSSWPLHMASIMIFSSLWGLALAEWKGSSWYTKSVLFTTLTTLIFSTVVIGYGTHMGATAKEQAYRDCMERIGDKARLVASLDASRQDWSQRVLREIETFAREKDVVDVYGGGKHRFAETPAMKEIKPERVREAMKNMVAAAKRIEALALPPVTSFSPHHDLLRQIGDSAKQIGELSDRKGYRSMELVPAIVD